MRNQNVLAAKLKRRLDKLYRGHATMSAPEIMLFGHALRLYSAGVGTIKTTGPADKDAKEVVLTKKRALEYCLGFIEMLEENYPKEKPKPQQTRRSTT